MKVTKCGIVNHDESNRVTIDGYNLVMEPELHTIFFDFLKVASCTIQNFGDKYTSKNFIYLIKNLSLHV